MLTFHQLYQRLLLASAANKTQEEISRLQDGQADQTQLDCLLHPERYPLIRRLKDCPCSPAEQEECAGRCPVGARYLDQHGVEADPGICVGCGGCAESCKWDTLAVSKDSVAVLEALRGKSGLGYALIAPAFLGQFSSEITPGHLRSAFKRMGFDGMLEVAVFADILTLKEALEFSKNIRTEKDYQLTSCCCPMWIGMIRKIYSELVPHVPPSVSPMIAAGRAVRLLHPGALTVFIGPCIAKKAEAREPDIRDAVDYVLTFQEMRDIFDVLGINPAELEEDNREFSSRAGRIDARAGGVSEAVQNTLERLDPHRSVEIRTKQADGVPACKAMIGELLAGKTDANFFEGMGCVGGCVGGPKVIIPKETAKRHVDQYGNATQYPTPIDNPLVVELLGRLGFDTPEELMEQSDIFTRRF